MSTIDSENQQADARRRAAQGSAQVRQESQGREEGAPGEEGGRPRSAMLSRRCHLRATRGKAGRTLNSARSPGAVHPALIWLVLQCWAFEGVRSLEIA